MNSATKNKQSPETLALMVDHAFPGCSIQIATELSEGFFSIAYAITLDNGQETIVKIAPPPGSLVMTYEKNIMYTEVSTMRLAAEKTTLPVAKVLFYQEDSSMFGTEYFFMEKLPGKSVNSLKDTLAPDVQLHIYETAGRYTAELNAITGQRFGYYGQPQCQGKDWHEVFRSMLQDAFQDARAESIETAVDAETVFTLLEEDRGLFGQVTTPCLVHWDIWSGNIFVENGEITGIIDFERCLWADPLMEAGFRSWASEPQAFLRGYGIEALTPYQARRSRWYDLYFFLLVSMETIYRQYDNLDMLHWSTPQLVDALKDLQEKRFEVSQ